MVLMVEFVEGMRILLEVKRAELGASLKTSRETILELGRVNQGTVDEVDATVSREILLLNFSVGNRVSKTLQLIAEALRRIKAGKYGICLGCDQLIAEKRLCALPWAKLCLRCQERADAVKVAPVGTELDSIPTGEEAFL